MPATRFILAALGPLVVFAAVLAGRSAIAERNGERLLEVALSQSSASFEADAITTVPYKGRYRTHKIKLLQKGGVLEMQSVDQPVRASVSGGEVHCYTGATSHTISGISTKPSQLALVRKNYRPVAAGQRKIAGRPANLLLLEPRHPERPRMTMALDEKLGVPLLTRKTDPHGRLLMETKVTRLSTSAGPALATTNRQFPDASMKPMSINSLKKRLDLRIGEPSFTPTGFRSAGSMLYKCPCGCSMKSAATRYTDGVASYTVFLTSAKDAVCESAECKTGGHTSGFGMGGVMGQKIGNVVVAIAGDLTEADGEKVLKSFRT